MDRVQRLKTRPQFQACLAADVVSRSPHFALHRAGLPDPSVSLAAESASTAPSGLRKPPALFGVSDVWLGAMVPKRWARRAVTRNAIKRQIYTVGASFEARLPEAAHLVRLRSGFDRSRFISASSDVLKRAVAAELQQLFSRAAVPQTPSTPERAP